MELAAEATAMMREEQWEVQTTKRIAEVGTNSIKSSQMGEEVLSHGLVEEKLAEAQVLADELINFHKTLWFFSISKCTRTKMVLHIYFENSYVMSEI